MIYYIDIVDACNLRCSTCVRGLRFLKNTDGRMSLETFKKILSKAKINGATTIALYNWTEPFLHPQLHDFIREVNNSGLKCLVSSNLSLKKIPNLKEVFNAGAFDLQVSVSGFSNDIHAINHRGSDIRIVKEHLVDISRILSEVDHDINVEVKYLVFDYNKSQINAFKSFAEDIGLDFLIHPGEGDPLEVGDEDDPLKKVSKKEGLNDRYLTVYTADMASGGTSFLNPCGLLFDMVVLNHKGEAFLCCAFETTELYKIGNFLEMPYSAMMLSRIFHPKCRTCTYARRKQTDSDIANLNSWFSDLHLFAEDPAKKKRIKDYSDSIKEIIWNENSISLVSCGNDPHFVLPDPVTLESARSYVVQIDIEAPVETVLQLFYRSVGEAFSEDKSKSHELKPGENNILLVLENVSGKTILRLDPGWHPGRYVITRFNVYEAV